MKPCHERRTWRLPTLPATLLLIGALCACSSKETLAPLPAVDLSRLPVKAQTQVAGAQAALAAATAESPVPLAARFGELGRQYQVYQMLAAAEVAYRNALALRPDAFEWRYLLAHTLREGNQHEAAAKAFDSAVELRPSEGAARYWGGQSWAEAGKPAEAKKRLEALLEDEPAHAAAMVALARILQQEGDLTRTVELLEKARAIDPKATEINYPLGMAYRTLGQEDKAQPLVAARGDTKVTLVDPVYADMKALAAGATVVLQAGNDAFAKGDMVAAEKAFRQALAEDPTNVTAYENLGVLLTRLDRGMEAVQVLKTAIGIDPNRVSTHFMLGSVYTRLGMGPEAVATLRQAVTLDPAHAGAHFNLANALLRAAQPPEALKEYQRVVELQPNNADARMLVGLLQVQAGQWGDAQTTLVAAATAVPDQPRIVEMLARLRAASPDEAVRDGQAALDMADRLMRSNADVNAAVTRAMALAELGRYSEAADLQSEALTAALGAQRKDLEPSLTYFLELYKAGKPARELWAPDDPLMPGVE